MNMMKYCPECYKEMPPDSVSCPFCGYKTGNGGEEELKAPKFLKTPQIDSYIPPEQTFLSLLLLLIFFWGFNIAVTVLPVFLNAGTMKNLLIAGISSQVITRILVGIWAVEEQSLKKDVTTNQKIGSFLLTFIPVGGFFSFLHASRTVIRKERLSNLTVAGIAAVLVMTILLYASKDGISALSLGAGAITPRATQDPVLAVVDPDDTNIPPTATQRAYANGCRNPNSVTAAEEGDIVEVCGEVTNYGDIDCESCPSGFYSFIKLDGKFQIISYDWHFSFAWLGDCMRVSDQVELLGEAPVFQFGKGEGYAGTECTTDARGELMCESGYYFQDYFSCDPGH